MSGDFAFRVYFKQRKQFFNVYLHDVHPNTFNRRGGGRWGYFIATWENPRRNFFGEIHIVKSRVRSDSVAHELDHLRTEWILSRGCTLNRGNEEKMASLLDELTRNFWREYRKWKNNTRL